MIDNKEITTENIETYLTFKLGEELFAANVEQVLTILEMKPITKVPNSPEYMRGVINLRGNVLPLIDMRVKFGMEPKEPTEETCIIVLNVKVENDEVQLGVLVDAVDEVLEIKDSEISKSPTIGTKYRVEFIKGMYKLAEGFIMLLNIDLVFSSDELLKLNTETEATVKETANVEE